MAEPAEPAPDQQRRIAALALPALGVLAAEPLYLLFDLAVVGRLGALALAGLAIGGLILGLVSSQGTFLSYGTTARSARHFGAGDRPAAVGEGVQATWLALGLGLLIIVVVEARGGAADVGDRRVRARSPTPPCRGCGSRSWVRPAILISLAGNGWMRGVQDTVRPLRYVVAGFAVSARAVPVLVYGWARAAAPGAGRFGGGQPGGPVAGGACCSAGRCWPSGCRCGRT